MATYTDDFNRATLGANWAAVNGGTWAISGSTVLQQTQATGTYRALRYVSAMDSADVDVSGTARSNANFIGFGILVRMPGSGTASTDIDGYAIVGFPGDTFYLLRFDNGSDAGVGFGYAWGTCNTNTDYTLRITVEGSTVTGYVDGTQRFQFTDTTYAGGSGQRSVAFISYGRTTQFDNFSAADIASGVSGSASITQAGQTVSAVGAVAIAGSAAITQAGNTLAAAGTVPAVGIIGSAAITQAAQSVAAAGVVAVVGVASITQDGQTVSAAGAVAIAGSAAITQAAQSVASVGVVAIVGAASITQDGNTLAAAGNVGNVPILGSAAITQDGQTVSAVGVVAIVGTASITQDGQTLAAAGAVAIVGGASMTQDGNTLAATMALDLVLTVVYGAVLGMRAGGGVRGSQTAGTVAGSKATGSM